jgi:hypothetical protein
MGKSNNEGVNAKAFQVDRISTVSTIIGIP